METELFSSEIFAKLLDLFLKSFPVKWMLLRLLIFALVVVTMHDDSRDRVQRISNIHQQVISALPLSLSCVMRVFPVTPGPDLDSVELASTLSLLMFDSCGTDSRLLIQTNATRFSSLQWKLWPVHLLVCTECDRISPETPQFQLILEWGSWFQRANQRGWTLPAYCWVELNVARSNSVHAQ